MLKKELIEQIRVMEIALAEIRKILEFESVDANKEAQALSALGRCTHCGELLAVNDAGKPVHTRGAHPSCYRTVKRMIERGQITESQAVSEGYWLPEQENKGRPRTKGTPEFHKVSKEAVKVMQRQNENRKKRKP
jgi:hypothetical protein